jgi:hypothetical protein
MAYSTCCGAHTNFTELGICPDCLEHCDWEDEDEDEPTDEQLLNNNKIEGGISFNNNSTWQGR